MYFRVLYGVTRPLTDSALQDIAQEDLSHFATPPYYLARTCAGSAPSWRSWGKIRLSMQVQVVYNCLLLSLNVCDLKCGCYCSCKQPILLSSKLLFIVLPTCCKRFNSLWAVIIHVIIYSYLVRTYAAAQTKPGNPTTIQTQYSMGPPPMIIHRIIDASPSPTDQVTGKIARPTSSDAPPVPPAPPKNIRQQSAQSIACVINTTSLQKYASPSSAQWGGCI